LEAMWIGRVWLDADAVVGAGCRCARGSHRSKASVKATARVPIIAQRSRCSLDMYRNDGGVFTSIR